MFCYGLVLLLSSPPLGTAFALYRQVRHLPAFCLDSSGRPTYDEYDETARESVHIKYDPFESDPEMLGRLRIEMSTVSALSTRNIKLELREMNLPASDIFDRNDLVRRLALGRLKQHLAKEGSLAQRQQQASLLIAEIKKVSLLSDEEVLRSLQQKIKVDLRGIGSRKEMDRKLAMLNLGYDVLVDTNGRSETGAPLQSRKFATENTSNLVGDFKVFATETAQLLKDSFGADDILKNSDGRLIAGKISGTFESARNFTGRLVYTKAELKAKRFINGKSPLELEEDENDVNLLNEDRSLQELAIEISRFETFDDVYYWALTKPRAVVIKLLQQKSVSIPRYSPLSTVASFLADKVMQEKQMRTSISDETPRELLDKPRDPFTRSHPNSSRKPTSSKFTVYEPERVLLTRIFSLVERAVTKTLPLLWERATKIELYEKLFSSILSELRTSPVTFSFGSLLRLVASGGSKFAKWLGKWAGGKLLSPSQTLFLASMYCIAMKRGILSFMGFLMTVRILRISLEYQEGVGKGSEEITNTPIAP